MKLNSMLLRNSKGEKIKRVGNVCSSKGHATFVVFGAVVLGTTIRNTTNSTELHRRKCMYNTNSHRDWCRPQALQYFLTVGVVPRKTTSTSSTTQTISSGFGMDNVCPPTPATFTHSSSRSLLVFGVFHGFSFFGVFGRTKKKSKVSGTIPKTQQHKFGLTHHGQDTKVKGP